MKNKRLAIITARGGSKRIPHKNIKLFCGKPIIAYSIEAALHSEVFDEVMVSTDDEEIKYIAESYGAKVPFLRSSRTSDDYATTADVLLEVVNSYIHQGKEFESICCLYPTAPFITVERLRQGIKLLENVDAVIPVTRFSYPPQRSLIIKNNKIEYCCPENSQKRSQDLEPYYHDCGQFYIIRTECLLREKNLIVKNTAPLIIDEFECQDIDTFDDWKMAELKYKLINEERRVAKDEPI